MPRYSKRNPPPAAKRNVTQREKDLIIVAEMYTKGETHQAITNHINTIRPDYDLSIATIGKDIKELHKRWLEAQLIPFDEAKAKELARIDKLESEYWFAWNRSLQKSEEVFTELIQDQTRNVGGTAPGYKREKVKKKEITTFGDPRYLQGIQWCIDKRCKIFGLDAPKAIDISWRDEAKMAGIDVDEYENKLVQEFVQAAKDGKTMIVVDDNKEQKDE